MTESGITRGILGAQTALALLGYMWPLAPQWVRGCVALAVGALGALSAALQAGNVGLVSVLPILGQGLTAAVVALGLAASVGAAQAKRGVTQLAMPTEPDLKRLGM